MPGFQDALESDQAGHLCPKNTEYPQREREMGHTDASGTGAYVTLQDEGQDVEELQLSVLHVCLDVLAHQGPAGGIARVSAARLCVE